MVGIVKYYQVFSISISEMFVFKLNFVLWRLRVVLQILLLFFLWSTVFSGGQVLFGYDKASILTYVFLVSFLRSFILSSRSIDVAGEIREGDLTNFLMRPVSYIGWWWARDLSDKAVNIGFAVVELSILYFIFKPPVIFPNDSIVLLSAIAIAFASLVLYFYLSFLISLASFWIAEAWGIRFLTMIIVDFLSGGFFPLDILPEPIFRFLSFTPFPYLLYFPAKVYLGQLPITEILGGLTILLLWIVVIVLAVRFVWVKGLRIYSGEGR